MRFLCRSKWFFLWAAIAAWICGAHFALCGETARENPSKRVGHFQADPNFGITLTPEKDSIQIPPEGGSFEYNVFLKNAGKTAVKFNLWAEVNLPDGEKIGPLVIKDNFRLAAGSGMQKVAIQKIPGLAPAGTYLFKLLAGIYPDKIVAQDEFPVYKIR